MAKWNKNKNKQAEEPVETSVPAETQVETAEQPAETEAVAVPAESNNFAVAAKKVEATGVDPVAPVEPTKAQATRGVLPDAFGNNVKGERICKNCGIKEAETLAKNPRYSFCKGLCVNCYGKIERKSVKPADMTEEQIKAKIAYYKDLLTKKVGAQGSPEGNATENVTIVTDNVTIVESGANLDAKADELAEVKAQ